MWKIDPTQLLNQVLTWIQWYAPYMTLANPESTQEGTLSEIKLGFMVCLQLGHDQVFADRIPRYHLD